MYWIPPCSLAGSSATFPIIATEVFSSHWQPLKRPGARNCFLMPSDGHSHCQRRNNPKGYLAIVTVYCFWHLWCCRRPCWCFSYCWHLYCCWHSCCCGYPFCCLWCSYSFFYCFANDCYCYIVWARKSTNSRVQCLFDIWWFESHRNTGVNILEDSLLACSEANGREGQQPTFYWLIFSTNGRWGNSRPQWT